MPANKDNIPSWYSYNKMRAVIYDREYDDPKKAFMQIFSVGYNAANRRYTYGNLRHDDTIVLAKALHMTPREYCNCFLNGVFEELKEED